MFVVNIRIRIIFIFLLFLSTFSGVKAIVQRDNYSYGLTFRSFEVNRDERTSLDLTPEEAINLKNGFTLEFDLKLYEARGTYGYVFRMIANDSVSLDMLSYLTDNKITFVLNNTKKAKASSEYRFTRSRLANKWVRVVVQAKAQSIVYTIDGDETVIPQSLDNFNINKIFFGTNNHHYFYTSDVPPMSVKNLIIRNHTGKIIRNWDMFKHGNDLVYDYVYHCPATVRNGVWEADRHIVWWPEISSVGKQVFRQIAVDSVGKRIFAANADSLYIFNLKERRIERIKTMGGEPFDEVYTQLIYDYKTNRLLSYNTDPYQLMTYDFSSRKWSGTPEERISLILHHNRVIDPENQHLFVVGGYGFFNYRAILADCNVQQQQWETQDLKEQFTPRYLASLGYLKDHKVLVFGGYGSITGLQEESAHNLYDLCRIDLVTKECVHLGNVSGIQGHYTFGNSMVINQSRQKFYTLGYRNDLYQSFIHLLEVDMKDMSCRMLADSIPYRFQDTEAFCDLFLTSDSMLYAVVCQRLKDKNYEIAIHSLKYPPLAKREVMQLPLEGNRKFTLFLSIVGLVLLFGGGVYYWKKRNLKSLEVEQKLEIQVSDEGIVKPETLRNPDVSLIEERPGSMFIPEKKKAVSSISLLGGFQIIDIHGEDLTGHFTPIIRQIFLITLLETVSSGKGITSEALNDLFWFDMDKTQATNNRNVNIRKLRLLLEKTGEVTLQKTNSYWQVSFGEGIACDYTEVMEVLNDIREHKPMDKKKIEKVVALAAGGVLLPNLDVEWGDKYKSEYSALLIEVLVKAATQKEIKSDLRLLIRLADVILLQDNIDEDSIRIKCSSLYQLGQKGLSKQCYDKYCSDYRSILNEDPTVKYEDLITGEEIH